MGGGEGRRGEERRGEYLFVGKWELGIGGLGLGLGIGGGVGIEIDWLAGWMDGWMGLWDDV